MDSSMDEPFDEALPSRALLEAYAVPEVPVGFTDRVMASMHAPAVAMPTRASNVPWIVAVTATIVAAAAVTVLAVRWSPAAPPAPAAPAVATATRPPEVPVAAAPAARVESSMPPTGDIIVVTQPRDATVRIDGVDMSNASGGSPHVRTKVGTGMHTIEVTREGFAPWRTTVDLPSRALQLEVILDAAPPSVAPVVTPPVVTPPVAIPRPRRPSKPAPTGSPDLKDPFGGSPSHRDRDEDRDEDRAEDRADLSDPFDPK